MKSRFVLENGQLRLQIPPVSEILRNLPNNPELLEYLKQHDAHYERFKKFQTWESTPMLALLSIFKNKLESEANAIGKQLGWNRQQPLENLPLVRGLIEKSRELVMKNKIELICLLMPTAEELSGNQYLAYNELALVLKSQSVSFIDVLPLFKNYSGTEGLFLDTYHGTYAAHQLIARELDQVISSLPEQKSMMVVKEKCPSSPVMR